jgi:hypothetical protein
MKFQLQPAWVLLAIIAAMGCRENEEPIYTVKQCEQQWNLALSCDRVKTDMDGDDIQEGCSLAVDYQNCLMESMHAACKSAYHAYYDCVLGIETCDELNSFYDGMVNPVNEGDTETDNVESSFVCETELTRYVEDCIDEWNQESDSETTATLCEAEQAAYLDFIETHTVESSDTEIDTDTSDVLDTDTGTEI